MNQKSFSLIAFVFSFPFVCLAAACAVDTDPLECATCTAGAGGGNAGTGGSSGVCTDGAHNNVHCCSNGSMGYQLCVNGAWDTACRGCSGGAGGSAGTGGTSGAGGMGNECGPYDFNTHCTKTCPAGQEGTANCQNGFWSDCFNCHPVGTGGSGGSNQFCTPNLFVDCTSECASGQTGTKQCNAQGTAYSACNCVSSQQYTHYRDADGDGHGTTGTGSNDKIVDSNPNAPAGYSNSHDDCNDSDASIYPGATELCDSKDNNCNGQIDEGCGTQDGGNPMSTITLDYTAAGDPDLNWAVPVIEGSWDGRNYAPFTGCTQSGLTAHCVFQMETGLVPSLKVQVALGNGKYWGDFSGAFPSDCKTPAEVAGISSTSVTVLGTLTIKVEGQPQTFHLCPNSVQKLPSCTGCCSASGAFPYYNAVLKPSGC